jgi:hypothetical protein
VQCLTSHKPRGLHGLLRGHSTFYAVSAVPCGSLFALRVVANRLRHYATAYLKIVSILASAPGKRLGADCRWTRPSPVSLRHRQEAANQESAVSQPPARRPANSHTSFGLAHRAHGVEQRQSNDTRVALLQGQRFLSVFSSLGPVVRVPGYIQRSRGPIPTLTDFLRSSGSGAGSTQPREYNRRVAGKKSSGSVLEMREYGSRDPTRKSWH